MAKSKTKKAQEPIEERPVQPLEGQEAFPGFEEKPQADAETGKTSNDETKAEAIEKAARVISYQMDYIRDPEDTLIAWGAPADFQIADLTTRFERLVKKTAEITGADPEQIRDKDKRTKEQQKVLTELAGQEMLARHEKFIKSLYADALAIVFDNPILEPGEIYKEGFEFDVIAEQSVIYFFAVNRDIKPLDAGELNAEQKAELLEVYQKLYAFYGERFSEYGDSLKYGETLSAFIRQENPTAAAEIIEAITVLPIEKIAYPLDKPNSVIWDGLSIADPNGQLKYMIDTGKKGSDQSLVLLGLDFDDLPGNITKSLCQYDKRVMIAAAALFNGGNNFISETQIYKQMGNKGRPNGDDLKKIDESLTKMTKGRIFVDNTKETEAQSGYTQFKYDGAILPFERVKKYINGQLCEGAIHLFREPPLITFARERKQITTIPRELLESPISKTEANLILEDYLLERIGHMKTAKGNVPKKILFKTVHTNCKITKAKQRQRTPDKIKRYLEHYKHCNWISDYIMEADGVKIIL